MKKIARNLAFVAIVAFSSLARAAPICTSEPQDKWMAEEVVKEKMATLGYERIKTFKISGSCYDIYGYTKDGKKAEVYFNPATGDIVWANIGG
jgi:hypothetical protein